MYRDPILYVYGRDITDASNAHPRRRNVRGCQIHRKMGLSLSPSERRETGLLQCASGIYTTDAIQTKYLEIPLFPDYSNVIG